MSSPTPNREAYDLARQAIAHHPDHLRPDQLDALARHCESTGARRFQLLMQMVEPTSPFDHSELAFVRGELTLEEYRRVWVAQSGRPVDERMVRAFYDEYEKRLFLYVNVLRLAREYLENGGRGGDEILRDLRAFCANAGLSSQEMKAAFELAVEARQMRRMAPVEFGGSRWPTVTALITHVATNFENNLTSLRGDVPPECLDALIVSLTTPEWPEPGFLQSELYEEAAAARSMMHERSSGAGVIHAETLTVTADVCGVTAGSATVLGVRPAEASPTAAAPPTRPHIRVNRWADLAIGYFPPDAYGFAFVPEHGQEVRVVADAKLPLTGKRLQVLFTLACNTSDGRRVSVKALLDEWRRFGIGIARGAPGAPRATDEQAADAKLRTAGSGLRTYLNQTLSELRGELRSAVECPESSSGRLLAREANDTLDLGFTVQALVEIARGTFYFGGAPK